MSEGVCSGISVAVSVANNKKRDRCFFACGTTSFDQTAKKVNTTTLFDLASLTKPLCTVLCTLALIEAGKFSWQSACLSGFDPNLVPEKKEITIHTLLRHASGLPAYKPYFQKFKSYGGRENAQHLLHRILAEPLIYPPGAKNLYSDLGFILMGQLIEKTAQQPIDSFFRQTITKPLRLDQKICFCPIGTVGKNEKIRTAATEYCPWRKKLMQGEVHDEHCWLMGGVAGHAGLFGTAESILSLCEHLLDCWLEKDSHPAFSNDLLRYTLEWRDSSNPWALGFDRPTPEQSSSGRYFSPNSVGHLGFTGTSFWIDPDRKMIAVLLTNRVHPSRENLKIKKFRPFFHDYILEQTGLA